MIGSAINSQAAPTIKPARAILPSDVLGISLLSPPDRQFLSDVLAVAFEDHHPAFAKARPHINLVGTQSTWAMSLCKIDCSLRLSHLMVTPAQFFPVTVP